MNRKQRVVVLVVLTALFLTGCNRQEKQQRVTIANTQRLEQIMEKNCNPDGGYHDITNANLYQADVLYFTYYSLTALEKLGSFAAMEDEILKETICNSSVQSFVKENYFDNLSNLYYFVEIMRMLNLQINEENTVFIREYVSGLQTKEGCFALSEKQKQKIDGLQYEEGGV